MSATATATKSERVYLLGGAQFSGFYERQSRDAGHDPQPHDEHLGGGWWLSVRDLIWQNGIEWKVHYQPDAQHPGEFAYASPAKTTKIEGACVPDGGFRVTTVFDGKPDSVEAWAAFGRAMNGSLADLARKAEALPVWAHPHVRRFSGV